jgi:Na+-driven multidrug efflux pump
VINIVLDITMIGLFGMGVAGAALATVLSQLVSVLLLAVFIKKKNCSLMISPCELRISGEISAEQMKTALPMALQGAVIAIGILIVQTAINSMGTVYVAGSTAGNKLFGPAMIGLFIDTAESEVIAYGHQFLLFYVMGYGFLTIQMSFCFALQGSGNAKMTVMSGILETVGRLFGSVVIAGAFGYVGVCLALPFAWVFTSVYIIPAYLLCRKRMTGNRNKLSGEAAVI